MKVKFRQSFYADFGLASRGKEMDLPKEKALALIKDGLAVGIASPVMEAPAEEAPEVPEAPAEPKKTAKAKAKKA